MSAVKRFFLILFVLASLLGIGYLVAYWLAWEPIFPTLQFLAVQPWFLIVEVVLLGIAAIGILAILFTTLALPKRSNRLIVDKDMGQVSIEREAINSTIKHAVELHHGLTIDSIKTKIVGKSDPKISAKVKINSGKVSGLSGIGSSLTDEIASSVQKLSGYPIEDLRVEFVYPNTDYVRSEEAVTYGQGYKADNAIETAPVG